MDVSMVVMIAVVAAMAGFWLGRMTTREPSEDEMMGRLIRFRADRKMRALSDEELRETFDASVEKLTKPWTPCPSCTDPMDCGSWRTCHSKERTK